MTLRRLAPIAALLVLLIVASGMASASPANVSLSLLYIHPIGSNASEIVARNLGPSGTGNGAIGFTVYLEYDHTKGSLASVTTGPDFAALNCGFGTFKADPHPLNPSGVQVDGTCTTSIPPAGVAAPTGNVVLATLNWTCTSPFTVDLKTNPVGSPALTEVFDPLFNEYFVPDNQLVDGGACGSPLAVTLAGVTASPVTPLGNALYPALSGALVLLAAAGVAFRGVLLRKP